MKTKKLMCEGKGGNFAGNLLLSLKEAVDTDQIANSISNLLDAYAEMSADDSDDVFAGTEDSYAFEVLSQNLWDTLEYSGLFKDSEKLLKVYNDILDTVFDGHTLTPDEIKLFLTEGKKISGKKVLTETKKVSKKKSLTEAEEVSGGMTLYDYAKNLEDGSMDVDVSDKYIDMLVAFCYDINSNDTEYPEMEKFLDTLAKRTKIVQQIHGSYGDTLVCDFSSVMKPYNDDWKKFFNMEYSEFDDDEAYYEAVANLEPLISGNASEREYKAVNDILDGKGYNDGSSDDSSKPTNKYNNDNIDDFGNWWEDNVDALSDNFEAIFNAPSVDPATSMTHDKWDEWTAEQYEIEKEKMGSMNESEDAEKAVARWNATADMVSSDLYDAYANEITNCKDLNSLKRLARKIFKDDRVDDVDYNELMDNEILNKFKELGYKFPEGESTYEVITKEVDKYNGPLDEACDKKRSQIVGKVKSKHNKKKKKLKESKTSNYKELIKESTWAGVPNTVYRYQGDWSDPMIEAGMCLFNEWDAQEYLSDEDRDLEQFIKDDPENAFYTLTELQPVGLADSFYDYLNSASSVEELQKKLEKLLKADDKVCVIPKEIIKHAIKMCKDNGEWDDEYERLSELIPEIVEVVEEELLSGDYHWSNQPVKEGCKVKRGKRKLKEEIDSKPEMRVYMNTWKNYNEYGADLEAYGIKDGWMSIDDAIEFCKKYAEDEPFINDYENTPWKLSEYDNAPQELQKIKEFTENHDEYEIQDIKNVAEALGGAEPDSSNYEEAEKIVEEGSYTFIPDIDNDYDLGYYIIDEFGLDGITNPDAYFDDEAWIRDAKMEWDDTDEREAFAEDKGIDVDDIDEDEFDAYMDEYMQGLLDDTRGDLTPDQIANYFDYEKLGRDLGFDGYTFTSDGVVRLD